MSLYILRYNTVICFYTRTFLLLKSPNVFVFFTFLVPAETQGKDYQLANPFLQHVSTGLLNGLHW